MIATTSAVVALSLAGASAAQAADRVTYADSVPSWATAANDAGAAPADQTVEGEIYLPLRDQAGAEALAKQVSNPAISGYRKALSPQQWIKRFSPTKADSDAVVNFLKAAGLTITAVPDSRQYVVFRGTPEQLGSIFGTSLHAFDYAGRHLVAPTSAPSLPAGIGAKVSGVSIEQSRTLTRPESIQQGDLGPSAEPQVARKQAAAAAPVIETPCSHYIGEHVVTVPPAYNGQTQYSTYNCGYTPQQLRSAYGLSDLSKKGVNGSGQTVAIIDAYASPTIVKDVNTYSQQNGEPGLTNSSYQQLVPAPSAFTDQELCQYPSGWQGEQTLDVESVHAVAPGARILYVGGTNCGGGLDVAMSKILDNKLATIVSNSYGNLGEAVPADVIQGEVNLHLQAAGEGIGLYFSSGDNGDEKANLGYPSPDFPASSPWVTSVGGTSMAIDKNGKIAYETGWGDTVDQIVKNPDGTLSYAEPLSGSRFVGGAGGGTSAVFTQPDYQRGIVPAALAKGMRVSPDVAALADPYTGFLIGIRPIVDDDTLATGDYVNETYGGTSLASPIVAAQIAVVQQATKTTIGFANPTLYAVKRVLPNAFRDVLPQNPTQAVAYTSKTSGNTYLVSFDQDTSLKTAVGYDPVTGLGDVSFDLLTQVAHGRH
ncbi:S53 family peptidase [Leifsonia sp. F6_8S_P_1B]|uniref:S53 family peptidase n=1 Tax=Leifsonia williamsii TaxID=3035919 RepID=A0ABT8K9R2_9MICO|nr:S53 family peptidase [Leifsonia williamsii]MDN4614201.1 S53 family peptidase [Leifsonia williamsii]